MGTAVSVWVSDDLKRRMGKVKGQVNWSAVASEAFDRKLGEIAATKRKKTMKDVVDRLRASDLEHATDQEKQGRVDGYEWAKHRAQTHELRRLDEYKAEVGTPWPRLFDSGNSQYDAGGLFCSFIYPLIDEDYERAAEQADEFWRAQGRECSGIEMEYAYGFAEGALDLWYEVKDQL